MNCCRLVTRPARSKASDWRSDFGLVVIRGGMDGRDKRGQDGATNSGAISQVVAQQEKRERAAFHRQPWLLERVPQRDRRLIFVVFVAEDADACVPSRNSRPSDGARPSQRAANTLRIWPLENTIDWSSAARRRAMTRSARAPTSAGCSPFGHPSRNRRPARALAENFAALAPFIVPIVPFEQVGVELGGFAESSEFAGAGRALQRTGEHPVELQSLETLAEPSRLALALFRERYVRASRMLAA